MQVIVDVIMADHRTTVVVVVDMTAVAAAAVTTVIVTVEVCGHFAVLYSILFVVCFAPSVVL